MKYITLTGIVFLFLIPTILSLDISDCKSDSTNWLCERGNLCVCSIDGTCTNGNLLVYGNDVSNLLCAPKISNNKVYIDWTFCNTTLDSVRIRADCDGGQTMERMIILSGLPTTVGTTSVPTTTLTTVTTTVEYTGMCGDEGYCEKIDNECLTGYGSCPEHDDECNVDERCCCPPTGITTTIPSDKGGFNFLWIIPIIIVVVVVLVYFFFIRGRERETMLTFKRLYEKWSR